MGGRVLIVGLCCVDLVNYVDKFPAEDSDIRVMEQRTSMGGNAANSATVFSQLARKGDRCELFAALPERNLLLESVIAQSGINIAAHCPRRPNVECPMSTIIINRQTGTRTILHYRAHLPELSAEEFCQEYGRKMGEFDWIHFEGRNFDEVRLMMEFIRGQRAEGRPRVSVELEKLRPYPHLEQLIPLADLLFLSKDFAQSKGWHSMEAAIEGIQREEATAETTVICAWGEKGAAARATRQSDMLLRPPFLPLPGPIVDTLGAGDCFIGTALLHLARGDQPLGAVLAEAVRVAGIKCTRQGLLGLSGR